MRIETKEKAKEMLNGIIKRLGSLYNPEDMLDDGYDSHDEEQNLRYRYIVRELNSIREELAGFDFDCIPSSECDRIWKAAWEGSTDRNLPEVRYNHAIEYASRLIAFLDK